jgi:hypothetical protein
MEQSLPQLHLSCRPTTNRNSQRIYLRGNIAVLSVVWFALTAFGCMAIARATNTTVLRANTQFAADAVALAYADHGHTQAEFLARTLGVTISSVVRNTEGNISIEVQGRRFRALSEAG